MGQTVRPLRNNHLTNGTCLWR